jgi:hypothetical protein
VAVKLVPETLSLVGEVGSLAALDTRLTSRQSYMVSRETVVVSSWERCPTSRTTTAAATAIDEAVHDDV